MTSTAPINFILANQWSQRPHGHGQSELTLVKKFLLENGQNAVILSTSSDFGDYQIELKDSWVSRLPTKLQRGVLFRRGNHLALKSQCKSWVSTIKHLTTSSTNHPRLCLTSSSLFELASCLKFLQDPFILHCRLTHFDGSFLSLRKNSDLILTALKSGRLKLAVETADAAESFEKITGWAIPVVFPAQGLMSPSLKDLRRQKNLGIFWPLTSYASIPEVETFLNAIPLNLPVSIRLPHRISQRDLSAIPPGWRFVEHGISLSQYVEEISRLDFVILPHNNYVSKGSGLAFEFISLGIPILTHCSNAFIRDIPTTVLLHTFNDFTVEEIRKGVQRLVATEIVDAQTEAKRIRGLVGQTWQAFLD